MWLCLALFCCFVRVGGSPFADEQHSSRNRQREEYVYQKRPDDLSASHTISFVIRQKNTDLLHSLLVAVSDHTSPRYGQHHTQISMGLFTENEEGAAEVLEWLRAHDDRGVEVLRVSKFHEFITARAPLHAWEDIFKTTFHVYTAHESLHHNYRVHLDRLSRGLESHFEPSFTRCDAYTFPRTLGRHVHVIDGLSHLPVPFAASSPKIEPVEQQQDEEDEGARRKLATYSNYVFPSSLKSFYRLQGSGSYGSSNTVQSVFGSLDQKFSLADLRSFQLAFALNATTAVTSTAGYMSNTACKDDLDSCAEASLDMQYVMAMGGGVPTTYHYLDDGSSSDVFLNWAYEVSAMSSPPAVHSISYAAYEASYISSGLTAYLDLFDVEMMKLGLRGVSVLAASGDDGVLGFFYSSLYSLYCGVYAMWPASSPYVLAVGATMGGVETSGGKFEKLCTSNNGSYITSGAGYSKRKNTTSSTWQFDSVSAYLATSGLKYSSSYFSGSYLDGYGSENKYYPRFYPDVVMAGNRFVVAMNGSLYAVSGTSASAPALAGLLSLVNSYRLRKGASTLGFLSPSIYNAAGNYTNDIYSGNNMCSRDKTKCCQAHGFQAYRGFDIASGWGSVDYAKLRAFYDPLTVAKVSLTLTQEVLGPSPSTIASRTVDVKRALQHAMAANFAYYLSPSNINVTYITASGSAAISVYYVVSAYIAGYRKDHGTEALNFLLCQLTNSSSVQGYNLHLYAKKLLSADSYILSSASSASILVNDGDTSYSGLVCASGAAANDDIPSEGSTIEFSFYLIIAVVAVVVFVGIGLYSTRVVKAMGLFGGAPVVVTVTEAAPGNLNHNSSFASSATPVYSAEGSLYSSVAMSTIVSAQPARPSGRHQSYRAGSSIASAAVAQSSASYDLEGRGGTSSASNSYDAAAVPVAVAYAV